MFPTNSLKIIEDFDELLFNIFEIRTERLKAQEYAVHISWSVRAIMPLHITPEDACISS